MGNLTLTRFFTLHTIVLPALVVLLVVVHLYFFRLHGVTPPWWESAEQLEAEEEPFWPKQVLKDALLALVFLVALGLWSYYRPAPLEAQADPSKPYEARPEWYFMFLFQLLRYFHGPYEVVGTFVLPLVFFLVLFLWPFLDRSPHRDPRRRPVVMSLLSLGTLGLVGLTIFAITTDVRMTEPEQAATKPPGPPVEPAGLIQLADVARVYNNQCAACHGVDGSGKQIRVGMPTIPDFTSLAWQMSQTDLEVTHQIHDGHEPLMPAYRDKLSQRQILALTIYIRAFAITPAQLAAAKPPQPPQPPAPTHVSPAQLYRDNCLSCHDADGRGRTVRKGMPNVPDLADVKWQASRSDAEIKHSILEGKGPFMLPMKDKLAAADVDRMVAYMRGFRGGKQLPGGPQLPDVPPPPDKPRVVPDPKKKPQTPPSEDTSARTRVAAGLYRQYCLSCHGADGRGQELKAGMPTIPDFTGRAYQEEVSNPQLVVGILDGKGTLMPAFRGRVGEEQAQDLAAYVRAFGPVRAAPAARPAGDFEKRFGELQDQWEELQKQLQELSRLPRKPGG